MKKYYEAIDVMKLVSAILVIIVHTNPLLPYFPIANFVLINVFGRISVPFFFLSSGYLFAAKLKEKGDSYYKGYIKRLVQIYLVWFIIYLPFGIYRLGDMIEITSPLIWVGAFIEALFLHGSYFHLWYMAALIIGIWIVYHFQKRFHINWLLGISAILFVIGLSETYFELFSKIPFVSAISDFYFKWFITTRNGFFFGLFFVAIGFEMQKEESMFQIKYPKYWTFLFFALLMLESLLLKKYSIPLNYNLLLMQVPFSICFFSYLKTIQFKKFKVTRKFREYNTLFYLTHAMFLELVPLALFFMGGMGLWNEGWFRFITVMTLTYLSSELLLWLRKRFGKSIVF